MLWGEKAFHDIGSSVKEFVPLLVHEDISEKIPEKGPFGWVDSSQSMEISFFNPKKPSHLEFRLPSLSILLTV